MSRPRIIPLQCYEKLSCEDRIYVRREIRFGRAGGDKRLQNRVSEVRISIQEEDRHAWFESREKLALFALVDNGFFEAIWVSFVFGIGTASTALYMRIHWLYRAIGYALQRLDASAIGLRIYFARYNSRGAIDRTFACPQDMVWAGCSEVSNRYLGFP